MPISGLVLSLTEPTAQRRETLRLLDEDSRIEVGVREGGRLAIVIETSSAEEDRALWRWLTELPGVIHVDLAFASFDRSGDQPQDDDPLADEGHVADEPLRNRK